MAKSIEIRPIALRDIREAQNWYNKWSMGLGDDLVREVRAAVQLAAEYPGRFAPVYRQLRRVLVDRFPYKMYFVERDDTILVIGALHGARNPRLIRRRYRST